MAEKSDVIREVIANPRFTDRVRTICAIKAASILAQEAPDAAQLTWAKAVVAPGYSAWTEAVLMLSTIAQRFRLREPPEARVVPEPSITLRFAHGLPMRAEARTPAPRAASERASSSPA